MDGARSDQCREARRVRYRERLIGELAGLAVASLKQRDDGRILLGMRTFDIAAMPRVADLLGQARRSLTDIRNSR